MAMTATPVFPQSPAVGLQNFVQGTDAALTYKTLLAAGANGTKVTGVVATSSDPSAAHAFVLAIERSGVKYALTACSIPVSSGTSGSAVNVDLLSGGASAYLVGLPVDNDGQKYLFLKSGDLLVGTFATALTASAKIDVITTGSDF